MFSYEMCSSNLLFPSGSCETLENLRIAKINQLLEIHDPKELFFSLLMDYFASLKDLKKL